MSHGCAMMTASSWDASVTLRGRAYRRLLAIMVLIVTVAGARAQTSQPADAPARHRSVLVLQSYYPTFTWSDQVTSGIAEVFAERAPQVDVHFEYMDAKRHPEESYLDQLHAVYVHKYSEHQTDIEAIICVDDQALDFVLNRGADLLPGVPAVFCGINGYEPAMRARGRPLTGVAEVLEPKATLDLALQLHPDTQRVVVICDHTRTGRFIEATARTAYEAYTSRLTFTYLDDMTMDDLLDKVAQLSDGTLVLLFVYNRDKAGRDYTHEYSLELIAQRCRVPIYGFWSFYLGHGIVGGKLVSGRRHGVTAAELALRVLNGEDAATIPVVTTAPNRYMFDDRQLRRFGIGADRLPPDSVVINETQSFYSENKALIWRVAGVIGGLSLLVIALAINVMRRRQAEARLRAALQTSMDGFCVLDCEGWILDVNSAYCQVIGYTRDELLRMHLRDIEAVESPAAVQEHTARVVREGADRFETQHRCKDGARIDVDVSATYMDWEGGRIFAFFRDITARKQTEETIRRNAVRLSSIFRAAPIGIGLVSRRVFLQVNDRFCEMVGRTADELIGRSARLLYASDEEFERVGREKYAQIAAQGMGTVESQWVRGDGQIIDVLLSSTPLDPQDLDVGVTFTALDITDRRRAELALRENEEKYRVLFETAADAIFLLSVDGDDLRVVECNERAAEMFGTTRTHLRTLAALELAPPNQPDGTSSQIACNERITRALAGESQFFEWRHGRVDGSPFDADVALTRVTLGAGQHLLAIVRDITERKRIAADLLERERLLDNIIEQNPYPMWISDAHGTLIRINRACCDLLNIGEEHVIGQYNVLRDNIVQEQGLLPLVQSVYDEGRTVHFTIDYDMTRWPLGRWDSTKHVILEVTIAPVRDEHGVLTNAVIMHHDITERRRAEEERQRLEAQLRQAQKMEAVGQLAGGVAHDFNNILTAILGNVDLLQRALAPKFAPDDMPIVGLQQVERGALRAADLTRQLLLFSRRGVAQLEALNLNQTLNDAVKLLQRLLTENVTLELHLAPDLLPVWADAGQLEQVIVNLVVNARDAMPDGGRVLIETSNATLDESYTMTHPEARPGPHVLLAVSDTGMGMSGETIEHIFEPFFTTKPVGQGTGLGLATVYGIVKQADGHVMAYSEVGRGSTFKVFLPALETPAAKAVRPAQPAEPLTGGTETILICEDDETVRRLVAQMLRDVGYTVLAAGGGDDALHQSSTHQGNIDLLISDVIMPDTNGKRLADALLQQRPQLKTLFISGYTANIIAHHGVLDDNVEFLAKPFSRRALLRRVREVLDGVRTAGSPEDG